MEEEEAPNLPLDIIYQIPKYISDPASLARAASSCKLWRAVIKDPAFLDGLKTRHLDHSFTSCLLLGFFYQDSAEAPEHFWQHHKDKTRCMAPSFTPMSELLPFTGRREGYNSARALSLGALIQSIGSSLNFYEPFASQDCFLVLCRHSKDPEGQCRADKGELLRPRHGTKRLDQELGLHYGEEALIFIPIVHDYHWFLITISVKDRIIHVLDSLPGESRESLICQIIKTLKEHLPQSNAGSKYKIDVVPVQKQSNTYDCGFHVLLFIENFERRYQICNINKEMVDEYRIKMSTDLILNPLNKRQTIITQSIEDDVVICLERGFSYNKNAFEAALDNDEAKYLDDNSDFSSPYNIDRGSEKAAAAGSEKAAAAGTPTSPRASVDTPDVSNDLLHPPETTQEDASLHPTQQIQEEDLETPVAPVRPRRVVRPLKRLTYSKKQIRRRRKYNKTSRRGRKVSLSKTPNDHIQNQDDLEEVSEHYDLRIEDLNTMT